MNRRKESKGEGWRGRTGKIGSNRGIGGVKNVDEKRKEKNENMGEGSEKIR